MRRLIILFCFCACVFSAFGQIEAGVRGSVGASRISNTFASAFEEWVVYPGPTGQLGVFAHLRAGSRFYFGSALMMGYVSGRDKLEIYGNGTGGVNGLFYRSNLFKYFGQVSLPVYFGLQFERFGFDMGFRVSYIPFSGGRQRVYEFNSNGPDRNVEENLGAMPIDVYDFGLRGGIVYRINDQFSVEGIYYHGLNNILEDNGGLIWRVQQAMLGLRYTLGASPSPD